MKRLLAGSAAALLLAAGCSEDPALYLGGPPGPATQIQLSWSRFALRIGESGVLGAQPRDAVGNPTGDAVTFSSCNSARVTASAATATNQWSHTASVTGVGLGESCVVVTAGSLTDTVRVGIAPGSIKIVGPTDVPSGGESTYGFEFYDLAGEQVTAGPDFVAVSVTTNQPTRVGVRPEDPLTWTAVGQQPGAATLRAITTFDFGTQADYNVSAVYSVNVVPGTFAGSLSATSAAPGELVTVTKAPDGPSFDTDSKAVLGTYEMWLDGYTSGTISFFVPAIGSTDAATLGLLDMGPTQIAQTTSFTPTKANEDVWSPGNIANDCSIPSTPVDYNANASPGGWVYMVHNQANQGNTGCVNGGSGYDHWFVYTTGDTDETMDILAYWNAAADNDIYVYSTDFSENPCNGYSGSEEDELECAGTALSANTSYFVIFSPYGHYSSVPNNNVRITIRPPE